MKLTVNIARILVGALFIFSGLVKAIDPLGLAYKMQEFFEAWSGGSVTGIWSWLSDHSLMLSMLMNTLEVGLGVALLLGWKRKFVTWALALLMIFFLFLTSYVLFSGKIRTCGCFGECIPLTPVQTFTKDVVLMILIIILLLGQKYILPLFRTMHLITLLVIALMATVYLQSNALEHLPIVDCLPYKKGNDILELRKMPADATFDKFAYSFIYKKGNEQKEFGMDNLPDSTWQFVDQKKTLTEKGNGKLPLINDFSLTDDNGSDVTDAVLGQHDQYYLFFIKILDEAKGDWQKGFEQLYKKAKEQKRPLYIVTADKQNVNAFMNVKHQYNLPVLICDGIAIKTAARCNPTVFLMNGPIVQGKWSWADINKAIKN
ncbi:BT_3928 family protein [Ferruginibacter albus]|uniref:BT_3928 family protein n=1 Tax=Ferruginibacter albus TaxID=2875540 RepID=UPI001CC6DEB1|nr:BT_3928 family protein [Ferruginibacter albus]UAY50916.1 DoxX family protein [Ferruginibacter albus]